MSGIDIKPRMTNVDSYFDALSTVKDNFYWDIDQKTKEIYGVFKEDENDDTLYNPFTVLSDDPRAINLDYESQMYIRDAFMNEEPCYPQLRSLLLIELGLGE